MTRRTFDRCPSYPAAQDAVRDARRDVEAALDGAVALAAAVNRARDHRAFSGALIPQLLRDLVAIEAEMAPMLRRAGGYAEDAVVWLDRCGQEVVS